MKQYLQRQSPPPGGVELVIQYGQTEYNSIRVCNTEYQWEYVGVTHEYVTSRTPHTKVPAISHTTQQDVFILHDLSNLFALRGPMSCSDAAKKRTRWKLDAQLLLDDLRENPTNTRTAFYLAQAPPPPTPHA